MNKQEQSNVAATKVKTKLLAHIQSIRNQATFTDAMENFQATTLEVKAQKESAINKLHTSFKKLHNILERREQELVEDAIAQQKLQNLSQQENFLSLAYSKLHTVIDYTEQCVSLSVRQ